MFFQPQASQAFVKIQLMYLQSKENNTDDCRNIAFTVFLNYIKVRCLPNLREAKASQSLE